MDFLNILNKANDMAREKFPEIQFFVEADGTPPGEVMTADEVKKWRFLFYIDLHSSVEVDYNDGIFEEPQKNPWPVLEDYRIDFPVKMDLNEAVQLMRKAGLIRAWSANVEWTN